MTTQSRWKAREIYKKIVLTFLLIVTVLAISDCSSSMNEETHADMSHADTTSTFIEVETYDSFDIVYDKNTKVMYIISSGAYNRGNFTMFVNADGTPKLWKE